MPEAPRRVVVATGNPGKVIEIRSALDLPGWEFVTAGDLGLATPEVVEDGDTFADNALLKARAFHELTGLPALADDSGLQVDALDGAPGVRSSRFAGEDATDQENNTLLLQELADIGPDDRTARFRCAVVLFDGVRAVEAEGACEGLIGLTPRGEGGFGYDPLFLPAAMPGSTMAELPLAAKNAISHRGAALAALRARLDR